MNLSYKLTEGALQTVMNGGHISSPVMQVLGSKQLTSGQIDNNRYRLLISDGKFKINVAMITVPVNDQILNNALNLYSIVALKRYMSNVIKNKEQKDIRVLLILELDLIEEGSKVGQILGDPIFLSDIDNVNSQSSENFASAGHSVILRKRPRTDQTFYPIPSLNPFHRNWVIQARIMNKTEIRTWSNPQSDGKLFKALFADRWGSIECVAFGEQVDKYYNYLEVDKVYTVRRCVLKEVNEKYSSHTHNFEILLNEESVIQESYNSSNCPEIQYNYTTIDKIISMVEGTLVDVLAVIKSVSDLISANSRSNQLYKKRDIILLDQSKIPIILTLWSQKAETFSAPQGTIISIKNALLHQFQSAKRLNCSFRTYIKLDPIVKEAKILKNWYENVGKNLEFTNMSARITEDTPWLTFQEAYRKVSQNSESVFYFQTFATILLINYDRIVYKSCPNSDCMKKIIDLANGMYRCEKCNREYSNFNYRFFVSMNLADCSKNQWVTAFTSETEKILGKTAQEVGDLVENNQGNAARIFDSINFKQFVFKCRIKMENYNDELKVKVLVVGVRLLDVEDYNSYLIKSIEEMRKVI